MAIVNRPAYQAQLEQTVTRQRRQLQERKSREAAKRRFIARALKKDGFTVDQIAWLTGVSKTQAYKDLTL